MQISQVAVLKKEDTEGTVMVCSGVKKENKILNIYLQGPFSDLKIETKLDQNVKGDIYRNGCKITLTSTDKLRNKDSRNTLILHLKIGKNKGKAWLCQLNEEGNNV